MMSCSYRVLAHHIAKIAGIAWEKLYVAMDVTRQQIAAVPDLSPAEVERLAHTIAMPTTCDTFRRGIHRVRSALIALGHTYSTDPCRTRWLAVAAILLVPPEYLPIPVSPAVIETVHQQWMTIAHTTADTATTNRATQGLAALWNVGAIPTELIDEAIRIGDRYAILTWMTYGVWDDRFETVCTDLSDAEIGMIVRAGVVPTAIVDRVAQRWQSEHLPWDAFPLPMWEWVTDHAIARQGRARTAATQLVRFPTVTDDYLIAAAADDARWAAMVLIKRPDITDTRLIAAVAHDGTCAVRVLIERADVRTDDRLIVSAAQEPVWASLALRFTDIRDNRLIERVAQSPGIAAMILCDTDIRDERLLAAAAQDDSWAAQVRTRCPDLRTNHRLSAATTRDE